MCHRWHVQADCLCPVCYSQPNTLLLVVNFLHEGKLLYETSFYCK